MSAISAVFAVATMACGSDAFTAAESTDGGGDAATSSDGGSTDGNSPQLDGSQGCITPPPSKPALADEIPFCNAYAEISSRCGACEACRQENANSCSTLGSALSTAFRDGITACKDVVTCDQFIQVSTLGTNPCVTAFVLDGGATDAQLLAREGYCENCAGDAGLENCRQNYFGLTDGGPGLGGLMLVASDDIANNVARTCSTTCGAGLYVFCELGQFCNSAGKDHCGQSTLCN